MELRRMALEGGGCGDWEGGMEDTPRTGFAEERILQVALENDGGGGGAILRYPKRGKLTEDTDSPWRKGRKKRRSPRAFQGTKCQRCDRQSKYRVFIICLTEIASSPKLTLAASLHALSLTPPSSP